jgi:hypothetical protein
MRDEGGSTIGGSAAAAGGIGRAQNGAEVAGEWWLGGVPTIERPIRSAAPPQQRSGATFVIGRAHGPRLLELLCAAG